jgi:hypothetical protein
MLIELALTNGYTFVGTVLIFSGLFTGLMTASYPETQSTVPLWVATAGMLLLFFGAA